MEDSNSTPSTSNDSAAPNHSWVVARALASAALFGWLGAKIGEWLGHRGNDPVNKMAKPMMKWSMGIFWGLLAAYSSLKVSEQQGERPTTATEPKVAKDDANVEAKVAVPDAPKTPRSKIEIQSMEEHGPVHLSPEHQRV